MKKPQILAIVLALTVAGAASLGGWTKIEPEHLKDQDVAEAAAFAVDQHNREGAENLKLVTVDSGESQVVNGKRYRLNLTVSDSGNADALSKYEAIVWVHPGGKSPKELTSFKKQTP
ncbi:unnamed protein product [Linum trigynum]|uniref:Cystatin domain-containing protein n=1 Tax=Linum trigynum TaxID=586398 RepID=A0AAV2C8H2_9ROSI